MPCRSWPRRYLVPRAGLAPDSVTAAGATLVDEIGFDQLGMALVAERLGVKTPSLYKHVASLADLGHRIAVLAATELGDAVGKATQGRSDSEALRAAAQALRGYAKQHPGRYAALNTARLMGDDDPLLRARGRLLEAFVAVLRGYRLSSDQEIHALRMVRSMMHGFVRLEANDAFQMDTDIDASFDWIISFVDQGLRSIDATASSGTATAEDPEGSRR